MEYIDCLQHLTAQEFCEWFFYRVEHFPIIYYGRFDDGEDWESEIIVELEKSGEVMQKSGEFGRGLLLFLNKLESMDDGCRVKIDGLRGALSIIRNLKTYEEKIVDLLLNWISNKKWFDVKVKFYAPYSIYSESLYSLTWTARSQARRSDVERLFENLSHPEYQHCLSNYLRWVWMPTCLTGYIRWSNSSCEIAAQQLIYLCEEMLIAEKWGCKLSLAMATWPIFKKLYAPELILQEIQRLLIGRNNKDEILNRIKKSFAPADTEILNLF